MRIKRIIQLITLLFCLPLVAGAGEFNVKRVIPVGPVSAKLTGSAKWSPNGHNICFFDTEGLRVADTNGKCSPVSFVDGLPRKFEWQSDSEILVSVIKDSGETRRQTLECINVNSKGTVIVERIEGPRHVATRQDRENLIDGPRLTAKGQLYYIKQRNGQKTIVYPHERPPLNAASQNQDDYILRWDLQSDGLYRVSCNLKDSVKLMERPQPRGVLMSPPVLSPNGDLLAYYNTLRSIATGEILPLPSLLDSMPTGADGCGFSEPIFDPLDGNNCFWSLSCDDGHRIISEITAIVNFDQRSLVPLDRLIGISGCQSPQFSPDGTKLSVRANNRIYIVFRGK